ncbi:Short-chain dehydrogenase/reductase SDR [Trinorchestia longiramus]|nr:Short-chain dehydrogenase/reductase SDR [Trinorchestia longiramus]
MLHGYDRRAQSSFSTPAIVKFWLKCPERSTMNVLSIDFTGKRALVTGAGSGIGRALALRLAELGAQVFALSRTQAHLDSLKAENPSIEIICVDLSDWSATRKSVEKLNPIHLLVNNAVLAIPCPILDIGPDNFNKCFSVNVLGPLNISQIVASGLISQGMKGNIVNISSVVGQKPWENTSLYSATKAALESLTKSFALEISSKGIRVNSVNPTLVTDTYWGEEGFGGSDGKGGAVSENNYLVFKARHPQGKLPCKNDVINAVVYLLSEQSDFINGHSLPVDSGYLCC